MIKGTRETAKCERLTCGDCDCVTSWKPMHEFEEFRRAGWRFLGRSKGRGWTCPKCMSDRILRAAIERMDTVCGN